MFDTWSAHTATYQGVIANNIGFSADRMCIQLFDAKTPANAATYKIYNNTCYRDNLNTGGDNMWGEINLAGTANGITWIITLSNNIAYQPLSVSTSGGGAVAAWVLGYSETGTLTNGTSGTQNIYLANNSSCHLTYCDSTFSAESNGASAADLGTNTYVNPTFTNTTDLLANQAGAPNCSSFTNVTACMGWNAVTSTLTTPSVISDLMPTSAYSAKGFQKPSTTCAANADYPTWLKGVVYLQASGTYPSITITETAGLVSKPCRL